MIIYVTLVLIYAKIERPRAISFGQVCFDLRTLCLISIGMSNRVLARHRRPSVLRPMWEDDLTTTTAILITQRSMGETVVSRKMFVSRGHKSAQRICS